MTRRPTPLLVLLLALGAQPCLASTSRTPPPAPRAAAQLQLPPDPIDAARRTVLTCVRQMRETRCAIGEQIVRAGITEDARATLLAHSANLEELLGRFEEALLGPQDTRSMLLSGILLEPLAARLGILQVELTLARMRSIITLQRSRAATLCRAEQRAVLLEQLGALDERLAMLRPSLDDAETGDAFQSIVRTFTPLLDESLALSDTVNAALEGAASPE